MVLKLPLSFLVSVTKDIQGIAISNWSPANSPICTLHPNQIKYINLKTLSVSNEYYWKAKDTTWSGFYWHLGRLYVGVIESTSQGNKLTHIHLGRYYRTTPIGHDSCVNRVGHILKDIDERISSIEFKEWCAIIHTKRHRWVVANINNKWGMGNWVVMKEIKRPQNITLYNIHNKVLVQLSCTPEYKALIVSLLNVIAYDERQWWF